MSFAERSGRSSWRVRYWRDDGAHGSIPGFTTKAAAQAKAREIDTDRARGDFLDPKVGEMPLSQWAAPWLDALDVAPTTLSQYRSLTRNHILPRWGNTAIADITSMDVITWTTALHRRGYAPTTITVIRKVFSMMLTDAVDDHLIARNPVQARRRGRRHHTPAREAIWATPDQALRVALNAAALSHPVDGLLLLTAAWTGARWGELTGLHRSNLHLAPVERARIVIDPNQGALHEVDRELYLGPPKTAESIRTISLPGFLSTLLARHLEQHRHPYVFTTVEGAFQRRSNFSRRVMRPAADGTTTGRHHFLPAGAPGLTFHGLRHSHKTWLIADQLPEVAQAARLGHRIPDEIRHVYSHVAPELDARVLATLEQRWSDALVSLAVTSWTDGIDQEQALPPGQGAAS